MSLIDMRRARFVALMLCGAAAPAAAQMDPEKRQLVQVGFNQALDRRGPLAAYAYYHLNVPNFFSPKRSLRLVSSPVKS